MDILELSEKYEISVNTIKDHFSRAQKTIEKKYGVKIIKEGRGVSAVYREEKVGGGVEDERALTIYDEKKDNFLINHESLKLINLDFYCFITIIMTPMLVFRGSYKDFCKYMGVADSKYMVGMVKKALKDLEEMEYINLIVDKTDKNYFIAGIYRKVEEEMKISINMIRECKKIADQNNKRSWILLLKTWLGIQICADEQPFTMARLKEVTGLSEYQLRESKKLLEQNELFKTSRAYSSYTECLGNNVLLNGFYNA